MLNRYMRFTLLLTILLMSSLSSGQELCSGILGSYQKNAKVLTQNILSDKSALKAHLIAIGGHLESLSVKYTLKEEALVVTPELGLSELNDFAYKVKHEFGIESVYDPYELLDSEADALIKIDDYLRVPTRLFLSLNAVMLGGPTFFEDHEWVHLRRSDYRAGKADRGSVLDGEVVLPDEVYSTLFGVKKLSVEELEAHAVSLSSYFKYVYEDLNQGYKKDQLSFFRDQKDHLKEFSAALFNAYSDASKGKLITSDKPAAIKRVMEKAEVDAYGDIIYGGSRLEVFDRKKGMIFVKATIPTEFGDVVFFTTKPIKFSGGGKELLLPANTIVMEEVLKQVREQVNDISAFSYRVYKASELMSINSPHAGKELAQRVQRILNEFMNL